jgi:hypothetical protein
MPNRIAPLTPEAPAPGEIVRRFNAACVALDAAIAAAQARDAASHDAELLQAAREMGSALELSLVRCCVFARSGERSAPGNFPEMLQRLRAEPALGLDDVRAGRLRRWRQLRNRAEHNPVRVPPLGELLDALRGTRAFLLDALEGAADVDALADPDRRATPAAVAPGEVGPRCQDSCRLPLNG